jgi:putative transposase
MSPIKRTHHAVYDLKYHFVWIPKYRKKLLKGDVAKFIRQIFERIASEYGWEVEEMAIQPDHIHIFLHAPPKYAPAQIVQIMKSISAREVFAQFPRLHEKLWAGEFWSDGYFVRSVGDQVTAETIKQYIRYQKDNGGPKQLSLWD